jgi:hypothetical protein
MGINACRCMMKCVAGPRDMPRRVPAHQRLSRGSRWFAGVAGGSCLSWPLLLLASKQSKLVYKTTTPGWGKRVPNKAATARVAGSQLHKKSMHPGVDRNWLTGTSKLIKHTRNADYICNIWSYEPYKFSSIQKNSRSLVKEHKKPGWS